MSRQLTFQKMFSKKKCEKKLREIQLLKQNKNKNHSADELEKINKEIYYKQFLKQNYEKKLAIIILHKDDLLLGLQEGDFYREKISYFTR